MSLPYNIADFRLPAYFPATVELTNLVVIPSDCCDPFGRGTVELVLVVQSCDLGEPCPYPWHIGLFEEVTE